jgi:hypothetical protein
VHRAGRTARYNTAGESLLVLLPQAGLENPGFKKNKPAQLVFWVFLGFLLFLYICPEERVFRVFSV